MDFQNLKEHWNAFGETDPLWAILTNPGTRGNQWDLEEFWKTGAQGVNAHLREAEELGFPRAYTSALDFGCGVGRLTQALATRFDKAVGVDIAASMIEQAREYNQHGERCEYVLNEREDLSVFESGSFDFVLSLIVLQHMQPLYSTRYMREFIRLLRPGGLAIFQIPARLKPIEPLPASAYRAGIEVLELNSTGPRSAEAVARVTNHGDHVWPANSEIKLGNHWLFPDGEPIIRDDGREPLREPLEPGESVEMRLAISLPAMPGDYLLELDMVQEGACWFAEYGSPTVAGPVEVTPEDPDAKMEIALEDGEPPKLEPVMEVYGVPRDQVEALIASSGGKLIKVRPDNAAGSIWESYTYFVAKPAALNLG